LFGIEGGDGLDEARYGEGIADAALPADQMQSSALASEGDGKFYEGGDPGAVDLRNVVEVDDQLARASLHEILGEVVQVLAGLADGEPAVNAQVMDTAGFARRDFQRWMKRHENSPQCELCRPPALKGRSVIEGSCIIR
jgi:hypothetical protein